MFEISWDQPFTDMIDYFDSKGYQVNPADWREVWRSANARSFSVANVGKMDILVDIRNAIQEAMETGVAIDEFKTDLEKTLSENGWLAPEGEDAEIELPDGTIRKRLTGYRIETIFQTNFQTSYQVGRFQQMELIADDRPFWQYKAVMDGSTRPTHAAQNNKIYPHDSAFWDRWFPPNGFRCRCYVKTLSDSQMKKRGLSTERALPDEMPDEGWDYHVGKAGLTALDIDLGKYPDALAKLYEDELKW